MIDKVWFGKRIAAFRRKAGLSQTELAGRLGVTSQAVSKWECGNAIPDIELLLDLSHLYRVPINELLEPIDLLGRLTGLPANPSEIAYFVPEHEEHDAAWADAMVRGEWIKRNWAEALAGNSYRTEIGRQLAACDGIILEIGAGPGGGAAGSLSGFEAGREADYLYRLCKPGHTCKTASGCTKGPA